MEYPERSWIKSAADAKSLPLYRAFQLICLHYNTSWIMESTQLLQLPIPESVTMTYCYRRLYTEGYLMINITSRVEAFKLSVPLFTVRLLQIEACFMSIYSLSLLCHELLNNSCIRLCHVRPPVKLTEIATSSACWILRQF